MEKAEGGMADPTSGCRYPLDLAGRIALGVALAGALALAILLLLIANDGGHTYLEVVTAHQLSHESLGPAMLIAGLVLLTLSAAMTWLIALQASFRYAGPLYRIERNLERALSEGPLPAIPIRGGDRLQAEFRQFSQALDALRAHHEALGQAVDAAEAADAQAWRAALARLEQIESRARL